MNKTQGSVLLEVLISIGIAAVVLSALLSLHVALVRSTQTVIERHEALWSMNEGLSAMRSMTFEDLIPGTTGALSFSGGAWSIFSGQTETLPNGMTRSVAVSAVPRDGNCVVSASGTSDSDSVSLTSTVTWTDRGGREHTQTQSTHRTRWSAPGGSCFQPQQASQVTFDLSQVNWHGGKQLRNLYIENDGEASVIIDRVTLTWDNGTQVDQMFLAETKVWSASGPGTPLGSQTTGTELNIQNVTLDDDETIEMHKVQFSAPMSGTTLTVTIMFSDGSTLMTDPFVPPS